MWGLTIFGGLPECLAVISKHLGPRVRVTTTTLRERGRRELFGRLPFSGGNLEAVEAVEGISKKRNDGEAVNLAPVEHIFR